MNILSIGNSFSNDAHRYISALAKQMDFPVTTVNLYIGGCALSRHFRNMHSGKQAYELVFNGESTGFAMDLQTALLSREWDVITLQQVSHEAPCYDTWQPYLTELSSYVRRLCPKAKQMIHQTWAYEAGSARLTERMHYTEPDEMLRDVRLSCARAAESIHADGIIPCGDAMLEAVKMGVPKIHRDTLHADLGVGRYLLACTWLTKLTGHDMRSVPVPALDCPVDPALLSIAAEAAHNAVARS